MKQTTKNKKVLALPLVKSTAPHGGADPAIKQEAMATSALARQVAENALHGVIDKETAMSVSRNLANSVGSISGMVNNEKIGYQKAKLNLQFAHAERKMPGIVNESIAIGRKLAASA